MEEVAAEPEVFLPIEQLGTNQARICAVGFDYVVHRRHCWSHRLAYKRLVQVHLAVVQEKVEFASAAVEEQLVASKRCLLGPWQSVSCSSGQVLVHYAVLFRGCRPSTHSLQVGVQ